MSLLNKFSGFFIAFLLLLQSSTPAAAAPPIGNFTNDKESLIDFSQFASLPGGINAPKQVSSRNVNRVFWHKSIDVPDILKGDATKGLALGVADTDLEKPKRIASAFVLKFRQELGIDASASQWEVIRSHLDNSKTEHVMMKQRYNGIPVFGADLTIHISQAKVIAVNGVYASSIQVTTTPRLAADQAYKKALEKFKFKQPVLKENGLCIFNGALLNANARDENILAYKLVIDDILQARSLVVFVDSQAGAILYSYSNWQDARNRVVYDLNGSTTVPGGTQVYNETGPIGSPPPPTADATSAWNFTGEVYDYYSTTFSRDSYDAAGATMKSYVRYGTMSNAYWDGTETVFGPGFATRDVVAHEWTHGVDQYSANLIYSDQSGALNEAMSDIFACMIDRDDWLLGEDTPDGTIRRLDDPSLLRDPGKVSEYLVTSSDNGGVHTNCTIPGHAAYLMSEGGTYNGRTITGIGRGPTENIFYRALTVYMTSSSSFIDAYNALRSACADLYGSGSATYANSTLALQAAEMDQPIPGYSPDAYEPDDTYTQANIINTDGTIQKHNFHDFGDNDWLKFSAQAGTVYTIETDNLDTNCDTYMYLYNTDGTTLITYNDDKAPPVDLGSRIQWTATSNGTYFIKVRSYDPTIYGPGTDYDICINPAKLIGADDATPQATHAAGYLVMDRFMAAGSGDVSQIRVKCTGSGNVKVALYTDSSGSPGVLLNADNTGAIVVAGWNTLSIPATSVTSGTYYWIAANSSANCMGYVAFSGADFRYRGFAYTNSFPSPATGISSAPNYHTVIAGWGTTGSKLVGMDDATPQATHAAGYLVMDRFMAAGSGDVSQIRVKCTGSGNVKVALYTDSSGSPGVLLNADNTGAIVVAGWNTLSIPATSVTSGTYYWIAANSSANCMGYVAFSGADFRYRGFAYTNSFPSPATGISSAPNYHTVIAGWGTTGSKLVGMDDATPQATHAAGYLVMDRFMAAGSGDVSQIRVKCTGSGNVKVALYTDSSGSPGVLLNADNTGAIVVAGWNTLSIPATSVTSGTYYWIAANSSANCMGYVAFSGADFRYQGFAYTNSFPSPATGISSAPNYHTVIAGWGTTGSKLVGMDDATPQATHAAGYLVMDRFMAAGSGDVSQIRVKCTGSGNVKVALYTDSSGSPGVLLNADNTGAIVVAGWNTLSIPATSVTSGTYYWIAANSSANCMGYVAFSGADFRYRGFAYTNSFPSPATGISSAPNYHTVIAGWGTTGSKLVGMDDATPQATHAAGYLVMDRFMAAGSGDVSQIRVKCTGSGNVKVALYTDSSGSPGVLLNADNTGAIVVAGWNTLSIPATSVTSGTYYWIAANSSANCMGYVAFSGADFRYQGFAYGSDFPGSAGTGFASSANSHTLVAGWGR